VSTLIRSLLNSKGSQLPCVSAIVSDIMSLISSESKSKSGSGGRSVVNTVNASARKSVTNAVDIRAGCSVADAVDNSSGRRGYAAAREEVRSPNVKAAVSGASSSKFNVPSAG
jgi:hypothetical protein